MARSSTADNGAASPPARSSNASFAALEGIHARDLEIVAEYAANGGGLMTSSVVRSTSTPCAFFSREAIDEHHGHQMPDILLGVLQHLRGAATVEPHRNGGPLLSVGLERRVASVDRR